MHRAIRLSIIALSAIATCVGWDAAVQAQIVLVSSQQAQSVTAQQPQFATLQTSQFVTALQPQYVLATPHFRGPLLPRLALVRAVPVQASSMAVVGAQVFTVSAGQIVSSGNYLVSSSLAAHGPVESVSQVDAPHLTRFVDASGNSLAGLLKGLLRQFLQNGGTTDQNSLLNIGKLILNAVLPFLTNTGGFDSASAINDLQKIINSLLNEKQGGSVVPNGQVQLAPGSYAVKFTDSTGKTTQGTVEIGTGTPPSPPHPNGLPADLKPNGGTIAPSP
jgi:hypothetical protein